IVKIYRNGLGKKKFEALQEYANHFIKFLDNSNTLFPDSVQEEYLLNSIYAYFQLIKATIEGKVHSSIDQRGKIEHKAINQIVADIIGEHYKKWEKADTIPSIPKSYSKNIADKYGKLIDQQIKEIFEELPMSRRHSNQLKKIASSLFSKFPEDIEKQDISGVVIAGFGEKDTFPSLESFNIEGVANNRLKYKKLVSREINFKTTASIVPFAQKEMVATFMEGVDPYLQRHMESYLSEVFDKYPEIIVEHMEKLDDNEKRLLQEKLKETSNKIFKDYKKGVQTHGRKHYVDPVLAVVSMLPKDELAAMAESLVNLTSFKRKVTMGSETVGGPIDVAVISKGDGFIWIKRKHYFKAELNPHFFANYY
ncbi:MAG: hypothetical protein AABX82_06190, partial [Nanoarchaeota archaeon]